MTHFGTRAAKKKWREIGRKKWYKKKRKKEKKKGGLMEGREIRGKKEKKREERQGTHTHT